VTQNEQPASDPGKSAIPDVFISHASEDKDTFVRGLAAELARLGLVVWFDEWTLRLGDSLRQRIEEGLARSRFGVVVLSRHFLEKPWPQAELDGLFTREMQGRKVILPVLHEISIDEIARRYPMMASKLAANSSDGVQEVALKICEVVRPGSTPANAERRRGMVVVVPAKEPLTELLRGLNHVAPLLHKLDEPLSGKEARLFLGAMQSFFYGSNLLTFDVDDDLRYGADNLLRVLAGAGHHPNYRSGKLAAAGTAFEEFRKDNAIGFALPEVTGQGSIGTELQYLHAGMMDLVERAQTLSAVDLRVLRLVVALLEYGRSQNRGEGGFPPIPPNIHYALRDYLAQAFSRHLGVSIPDTLENILTADMKEYCAYAWRELVEEDRVGWRGFVGAWTHWFLDRLRFRR
jgi:hypothetical protein